MIAIVDYGAGNLNSVKKAFDYLGAEVVVTDQPEIVAGLTPKCFRWQAVSRNLLGNAVALRRE